MLQADDWYGSHVVARLRPDVSLASAIAQVGAVQYQNHFQYPHDPVAEDVVSRSLNENVDGEEKKPLTVMLPATGAVLRTDRLTVAKRLEAAGAERPEDAVLRLALGRR